MRSIFNKILYEQLDKHDTVLAVIYKDKGSAPRGKGAMMLVSKYGIQAGTIGGGAVEKKSCEIALDIINNTKTSTIHDFILRPNKDEDIGMVCGGDVTVYFQYISHEDEEFNKLARMVLEKIEKREKSSLVIYTDNSGMALIDENRNSVIGELRKTENAFELPVPIGERVFIFGAGHIARALTPILSSVGFRVNVFDNRSEFAIKENFPTAENVILGDYLNISDYITLTPEDYIIVMSHGHSFDLQIQKQLLDKKYAYFGAIGSAKKIAFINEKLTSAGISQEILDTVHTPIGLKIKAITPEEIAVSIAAELILSRADNKYE